MLPPDLLEQVRGGGWDLDSLSRVVDQFVIHYDVAGSSRQCFRVLHDVRGLSVHFMIDVDGTIYQTLDLKERAWHATTSNDRSIGVEIAQIGAYPFPEKGPVIPSTLAAWYVPDPDGPEGQKVRVNFPASMGDGGVRTPGFVARPRSDQPVVGMVQGRALVQYDLTTQQYDSLIKLTAALCTVFPNLPCECPRNPDGSPKRETLPPEELAGYRGLLGHYNIQDNKSDPGPAFDWDRVIGGARVRMKR